MNQPDPRIPNPDVKPIAGQPDEIAATLGEITSEQLLGGKAEVLIRHGGELYRLRLTRNGKLILQK